MYPTLGHPLQGAMSHWLKIIALNPVAKLYFKK